VDLAVVETGLGGRLYSTNILIPELSIITNISLDHQNLLGDTVEKIAFEKAGIIKPGVPCLIGEYQHRTQPVFKRVASSLGAAIRYADRHGKVIKIAGGHYRYLSKKRPQESLELLTPVLGPYQEKNINTTLEAIRLLNETGNWSVSHRHIREGFKNLSENAPLTGRWQWIGGQPRVLVDGAHNLAGLQYLFKELEKTEKGQVHCVFGTVRDKDLDPVLAILPRHFTYYFVNADLPRAMNSDLLVEQAARHGLQGSSYGKVSLGLKAAKRAARGNDLVLVTGSIFVVGEVLGSVTGGHK
jgi:dihydrofolate synthase/folylpolyglutamate synthase